MSLVNQSYRLIAILLQSILSKKMEDLVTIRNTLFYLYPWIFPHTYSIGSIDPIQKKIMFRNFIIQFFNLEYS